MFLKSGWVLGCLSVSVVAGLAAVAIQVVRAEVVIERGAQGGVGHGFLSVNWSAGGPESELKSWDLPALSSFKTVSTQEKDPASGKLTFYQGVLLSQVLEKAMEGLTGDRKAQVDLVILKNASGGQVLLPRSVITKYPVLVALRDGNASIIMPWTSKPKLLQEGLPVESYFLSGVVRVELSNYRERFPTVFLKRRTDPLAMRGEKLFVQNCIGCHSQGKVPTISDISGASHARHLASGGHPEMKGGPKLDERDRRALVSYLDAYRGEVAAGAVTEASKKSSLPSFISNLFGGQTPAK